MIENNGEVSQLILRKAYLTSDKNLSRFLKSLQTMPNLIHLDLANNALENQGIELNKNFSVKF